ncbi:MAG: M20/M25/M40 family metallo-hydrolase [bacterium]|nr:M20/M25/M40 family metallo-hydrolase [bacterium]
MSRVWPSRKSPLGPPFFKGGKSEGEGVAVMVVAAALAVWVLAVGPAGAAPIHHDLEIELDPANETLRVTDRITLSGDDGAVEFLLNSALTVTDSSVPVEKVPTGDVEPFFGNNGTSADLDVELARYRVDGAAELSVTYEGTFHFALGDQKEEYARGFRETAGIVGEEGVFLAGSSFWVPYFDPELFTFELEASSPEGWHVISQGGGTSRGEDGKTRWRSEEPMEEVYLVGGPLVVHRDQAGAVEALVYLRERDDVLAGKYLEATAQYLEMYRGLFGPYPYDKFALVENFWETGYGMPSFTLLGPRVIRFPFILHSSYPHEILHNWWGNSVFVDYLSGNWCEGLTAYLADHLIKEQRGQGALYRRDALQRYRSYVQQGEDFPLVDFRSRHSAATEAVGYGKSLMGFHMLRRGMGDEAFVRGLQDFFRRNRGRRATFEDLRQSFEKASEQDLERFFHDWTRRAGAAALRLTVEGVEQAGESYRVTGRIEQTQGGEPLALRVPLVVQTASGAVTEVLPADGSGTGFELVTAEPPLALHADPAFDLFRLLDPREIPPSIGQIFGEPRILAVLPGDAGSEEQGQYRELMAAWQSDSHDIEVRTDSEVDDLPADRAVWLLGAGNRFAGELFAPDPALGFEVGAEGLSIQQEEIPYSDHSLVVVNRHPADPSRAVGWLVVEPAAAFPGMARKLPHYGKYSYLGFEGDEPTNVVKGQWPTADSPLRVDLRPAGERTSALPSPKLEKRAALAELPPVFSQKALMAHVETLAAPELEGRGVGSGGLRQAADYVAEKLAAAGLQPGGDDGGWFQEFTVAGPEGESVTVRNVIGVLPAGDAERAEESVILSAHVDHLGSGWPDVHQGDEGKVHPGADDNASGVAVFLELAKSFAGGEPPLRNLVFVAFTAEEAGRLGSLHYVEHPNFPFEKTLGVVNLDTVGRLFDQKLTVLGTGTATEWQHIFRGVGFVTGIESRNVAGTAEGSDQWSFIEKGVPGVQIFTQAHGDYHRPGDTADKIDGAGLVKVATFVKESVAYLAGERQEPLTVTIEAAGEKAAPRPAGASGRRVSFGSVPEFSHPGPGVLLSGVTPGSPAESAGLKEGDLLLRIDDHEIADLRAFSEVLKSLTPGQTVDVVYRRGEEELATEVTVTAR